MKRRTRCEESSPSRWASVETAQQVTHAEAAAQELEAQPAKRIETENMALQEEIRGLRLPSYTVNKIIGGVAANELSKISLVEKVTTKNGACSIVLDARTPSHKQVVLKVMLNPDCANHAEENIMKRFSGECGPAADANRLPLHPNICTVLHYFVDDASVLPEFHDIYLSGRESFVNPKTMIRVLPLLGKDLATLIKKDLLTEKHHMSLALDLLDAVSHLKEHRIIHRDIKADNVLARDEGLSAFVLTDLGECFDAQKWVREGFRIKFCGQSCGGAAAYFSPEVSAAAAEPGPEAYVDHSMQDEWAVGFLLHKVCGGGDPFGVGEYGVPARFAQDAYRHPPLASVELLLVVERLLKVDPRRRITAADARMLCRGSRWPNQHGCLRRQCRLK